MLAAVNQDIGDRFQRDRVWIRRVKREVGAVGESKPHRRLTLLCVNRWLRCQRHRQEGSTGVRH